MFKRSRLLFNHKKKTNKKLLLLWIPVLCLGIIYFSTHYFLQQKFSVILDKQQALLQKQNITLKFQSITHSSWSIWPYLIATYPTLHKNEFNTTTQFFWQAKQAKITYSLWHPLSIVIQIDGNQLFCTDQKSNSCFQIHGKSWNISLPLIDNSTNQSISLQCDETFYTNNVQYTGTIRSLQLTKLQADLYWNNASLKTNNNLGFSKIDIHKALINFTNLPPQVLQNVKLQAALIQENDPKESSKNLYKLLIQQANLSWNDLSVNTSGKLYIPYPKIIPTGEFSVNLNGVNQTIYQQLIPSTCCQKLKEELITTPLPSQLNFTLLVREGTFYLGAIPLQPSWYNTFQTLIRTYTK